MCNGIDFLYKVIVFVAQDHVTRWIVDQNYRKEQDRLKIPYGKYFNLTSKCRCEYSCFLSVLWREDSTLSMSQESYYR